MTQGEKRNLWVGLAFISPWLVGFLVFTVFPFCASMFFSFCDYDVLTKPVWVGTLNYRDMFTDSVFWKSLYNTLYYAMFSLPRSEEHKSELQSRCNLVCRLLLEQSRCGTPTAWWASSGASCGSMNSEGPG